MKIKIHTGTQKIINDTCEIVIAKNIYWVDQWWLRKIVNKTISNILEFFPSVSFHLKPYINPLPNSRCQRPICLFLDRFYELHWDVLDYGNDEKIDKQHDKYLDKYGLFLSHKRFEEMWTGNYGTE